MITYKQALLVTLAAVAVIILFLVMIGIVIAGLQFFGVWSLLITVPIDIFLLAGLVWLAAYLG